MKKQNKNNTKISWQIKDKREIEEPTVIQELRKGMALTCGDPLYRWAISFVTNSWKTTKKNSSNSKWKKCRKETELSWKLFSQSILYVIIPYILLCDLISFYYIAPHFGAGAIVSSFKRTHTQKSWGQKKTCCRVSLSAIKFRLTAGIRCTFE